eukprot:scaffold40733_cov19-Tisochrysis_lutea.AAC.1
MQTANRFAVKDKMSALHAEGPQQCAALCQSACLDLLFLELVNAVCCCVLTIFVNGAFSREC